MVVVAEVALEEAIRLGLVPEEKLREFWEQGLLTSPFLAGRFSARSLPFWRMPALWRWARGDIRPETSLPFARPRGLREPRFGLGPLAQGLALSPPMAALRGGLPPVGRARSRGAQPPAPLETLLGRGDLNEIARRIEEGLLDPALLLPEVRAAVSSMIRRAPSPAGAPAAPARPSAAQAAAEPEGRGAGGDLTRALAVLRLAQQAGKLLPQGPAPSGQTEPTVGPEFTEEMAAEFDRLGGFGGEPLAEGEPTAGPEFTPEQAAELDRGFGLGLPTEGVVELPSGPGPDEAYQAYLEEIAREVLGPPQVDGALSPIVERWAIETGNAEYLPQLRTGELTPEMIVAQRAMGVLPTGLPLNAPPVVAPQGAFFADGAETTPFEATAPRASAPPPLPPTVEELRQEGLTPADVEAAFGAEQGPMPFTLEDIRTAIEAEHGPTGAEGFTVPPGILKTLNILGGVTSLAGGAQQLSEGRELGGSLALASGGVQLASELGYSVPYAGAALALANIGAGLAQGDQAGERAAVTALASMMPYVGWANLAQILINLGLSEYKQGDLSKRIMNAKQQYFAQYGNQATTEALRKAPDFAAAIRSLSAAPPGTSGQVQFGVGTEYAGMTLVGRGGSTESPQWRNILAAVANPALLANHPDLVASFVQNLWVQTGPGGAASFDPAATRDYQTYLLAQLPNTPEWLAAKQKILAMEAVDPRDPAALERATKAVPDLPVEPGFLRVNGLRLPVDHEYQWYDGASGIWYEYSPERVAQTLTPWGSGTVFDKTTGQWLGAGGQPRAAVDAAYLDAEAMQQPSFRAKAEAERNRLSGLLPSPTVGGWVGEDYRENLPNPEYARFAPEVAALGRAEAFLATPPPVQPAPEATPSEPVVAQVAPEPAPETPPPPPPPAAPLPSTSTTEMPSAAPSPASPRLMLGEPWVLQPDQATYEHRQTGEVISAFGPPPAGEPEPEPLLYTGFRHGGVIPRTGLYRLHAGETVVPASHEQSETIQDDAGRWINVYGRGRPKAGQPLPRKYPFERDAYDTVEEAEAAARRRSQEEDRHKESAPEGGDTKGVGQPAPEGRYYLDPKRGMPFEAKTNPEPRRVWRLVFDADQLHEAWGTRGKDGWPLLVPASALEREDWPRLVEQARRTQYERVHPSVLLARAVPLADIEPPGAQEGIEADERFFEGYQEDRLGLRNAPQVPTPEPTPPMRQQPGSRPMRPEEWQGIRWPKPEV